MDLAYSTLRAYGRGDFLLESVEGGAQRGTLHGNSGTIPRALSLGRLLSLPL